MRKKKSQTVINAEIEAEETNQFRLQQEAINTYIRGCTLWTQGIKFLEEKKPDSFVKALSIFKQLLPVYHLLETTYHGINGLVAFHLVSDRRFQQQYFAEEKAKISEIISSLQKTIKSPEVEDIDLIKKTKSEEEAHLLHEKTVNDTLVHMHMLCVLWTRGTQSLKEGTLTSFKEALYTFKEIAKAYDTAPLGDAQKQYFAKEKAKTIEIISNLENRIKSLENRNKTKSAFPIPVSTKKRKNPPTPISAQFTLPKGFNKEDFKSIATKLQKLDTRSKTHQQNAFDNEEAIQAIADLLTSANFHVIDSSL